MATTYRLFEIAERLEILAGEIYLLLAARFEAHPAARDLFRRLAAEEAQHATRVRLLAARYRSDPRLFDEARALRAGALDAEAILGEATATHRLVESGGWRGDLETVRERLVRFEESCAGLHAELLSVGAHPEVRRFFEALASQDREHRRLLEALPRPRAVA